MVSIYGLNDKIGNISFYDSSGQSDYSFQRPYSEKTAELIDNEVKALVDKAYVRTKQILNANKDKLTELAELLLEKEVIFKEDMERIFGSRSFSKDEEPLIHEADQLEATKETEEAKVDPDPSANNGAASIKDETSKDVSDEPSPSESTEASDNEEKHESAA